MVHSFTDIYKQIYEHLDDKELEAQKSTQDLLRFIAQKAEETESLKNLKQTEKKSFSREECLVLKDLGLVAFQKQDHGNAIHLYSRFLELCASAENKDEFKGTSKIQKNGCRFLNLKIQLMYFRSSPPGVLGTCRSLVQHRKLPPLY